MEKRNVILKNIDWHKYAQLLPKLKEKKTQVFITLALTFATLSVFGFFAINPTLSTIAQLKRELSDSKVVNDKLEQKIVNLSILQNKYTQLQNDIPFILRAIPQSPLAPLLIGQIQSVAQEQNLTVNKVQVYQVELGTSDKSLSRAYSFNFSFQALGSYSDLQNFVDSLVQFERVVTIDSITLNSDLTLTSPLRLNVRGKAYFKK